MGKLTLPDTYIFNGKFYGPGEVEIEDEAAYTALKAKLDAAAKAKADAEPPIVAAEDETQAANRAAEKKAR